MANTTSAKNQAATAIRKSVNAARSPANGRRRDRRQQREIADWVRKRADRCEGAAAQLRNRRQQHEMHERHPAANHDDGDVGPDAPGQELLPGARGRQGQQPDEQARVEGEIEGIGNGRKRLQPGEVIAAVEEVSDEAAGQRHREQAPGKP
jgi:hypothetical protein